MLRNNIVQMPYSIWKKLSQLNRQLTGKLQVTLLFAYFPKGNCALTILKPLRKKKF